jgi:VanZ family protein
VTAGAAVRLLRAAFWGALLVIAAFAFGPPVGPEGPEHLDKLNHLLAFAVLAVLAQAAYPDRPRAPLRWTLLLAYGLLIEAVQAFLPQRELSLLDLAADGAGVLAGALIYRVLGLSRWQPGAPEGPDRG